MSLPTQHNPAAEPVVASVVYWQRDSDDGPWEQLRAGFITVDAANGLLVAYVEMGGAPDWVGFAPGDLVEWLVAQVRRVRGVPRTFANGGEWR